MNEALINLRNLAQKAVDDEAAYQKAMTDDQPYSVIRELSRKSSDSEIEYAEASHPLVMIALINTFETATNALSSLHAAIVGEDGHEENDSAKATHMASLDARSIDSQELNGLCALRDASWTSTPTTRPKYHALVTTDHRSITYAQAACSSRIVAHREEFTDMDKIKPQLRCQNKACAKLFREHKYQP